MASENGQHGKAAQAPDAAVYIASIADELARLAKSHDMEALAYILDMARFEADQISQHRANAQGPRAASG